MIHFTSEVDNKTFYVVFDKFRGRKMFWNFFTREGFDHVYLLTPIGTQTLAILPTPTECSFDIWPCTIEEAIKWQPNDVTAILRYSSKYKSLKIWRPRGMIYCVTCVKYILGVDGFSFTPKQLYNQLIKIGAENGKQQ